MGKENREATYGEMVMSAVDMRDPIEAERIIAQIVNNSRFGEDVIRNKTAEKKRKNLKIKI